MLIIYALPLGGFREVRAAPGSWGGVQQSYAPENPTGLEAAESNYAETRVFRNRAYCKSSNGTFMIGYCRQA